MSVSGGMVGSSIQERVRTPLRVALEARLALALCLPPIGAVNQVISKRGTIMIPKRRVIVKFVAGMACRIFGLVGVSKAATDRNFWVRNAFDGRYEKILTLFAGRFRRHCFSMDYWRRLRTQESNEIRSQASICGLR